MVTVPAQPPGVSSKSLPSLGTNSTQTPIGGSSSAAIMIELNIDTNEVFCNLVDSIKACNHVVRKINETKCYHRIDLNCIEVVSDDEVEVDMPNINNFMNI